MTTPLLDTPAVDAELPADAHGDVATLPPTAGARFAAVVAVLALLVGGLALPSGPSSSDPTRFASLVAGPLEVGDGETWRTLPEGEAVEDGWSLRAVGGAVTLAVDDGRVVLATGGRAAVVDGRLLVDRGSVLVDDAPGREVVVGGVSAAGTGTWRVDAGGQPRLATYDGQLTADDGRSEVDLPPYRQLTVRDRTVSGAGPVPLRYLSSDPFDREQLDEALRVDELAQALARSLTSTYGDAPRDLDFYASFLAVGPEIEPHLDDLALVSSGNRFGPPAEVLIGVTVADAVAGLTGGTVADTAATVSSMRERGAEWGLLLVAAGGGTQAFNDAAGRLLEEAAADPPPPLEDAEVEPDTDGDATPETEAPAPAPSPPAPTGGAGGGAGGGTTGGGGGGGGTGGGGSAPTPSQPAPPSPAPSGPLAPVEGAVRELGRGLGGTVEGVTDTVGDVVGGVDELLAPSLGGLLGGS